MFSEGYKVIHSELQGNSEIRDEFTDRLHRKYLPHGMFSWTYAWRKFVLLWSLLNLKKYELHWQWILEVFHMCAMIVVCKYIK
jgi:hypothetical protein